ncbi:MAG: carbohydrate kinase family protein [Sarcina sp.]
MKKVFCIGELLIDFVSTDLRGLKDGIKFEKKAGGAPANVAVTVSKLGGESIFLGQVGDDSFGDFLVKKLREYNVKTNMIKREGKTTLAFVAIDEKGERSFEFFKGSDGEYSLKDIDFNLIPNDAIVHFGSATAFLDSNLRKTYYKLLNYCYDNNIFISFDPNYRDMLVDDKMQIVNDYKYFISRANFVKLSDEELELISETESIDKGVRLIRNFTQAMVAITLGASGSFINIGDKSKIIPSIPVKQVDSTGAGDAFVGAFLFELAKLEKPIILDEFKIEEFITFANKIGAKTCENYGAMEAIPSIDNDSLN